MRRLLFGGVPSRSWLFELGITPLRVVAGLSLSLGHGLGKWPPSERFVASVAGFGFPVPELLAWAAAVAELVGGLLLAVGLLTRPSALMILCTMTVALLFQHADDPFAVKEKALLFGAIATAFLCLGAGRWSLDARLVKR